MGKYDPLAAFLTHRRTARLTVSFAEVAAVVPGGLPASAYQRAAWWANDGNGRHVQARAWLAAGFRTESVDVAAGRVTFVRASGPRGR